MTIISLSRRAVLYFSELERVRHRAIRYKRTLKVNGMLERKLAAEYGEAIQEYWLAHYGRRIDPVWHTAYFNVTGIEDVRYIPHDVWWESVIPFFNDSDMQFAYKDKNIYDLLFRGAAAPIAVIKRVRGRYYDVNKKMLAPADVRKVLEAGVKEKIIKPSRADNGRDIRSISACQGQMTLNGCRVTLPEIEDLYGLNFLVQEKLTQHKAMGSVHPDSINSLRMATLRWRGGVRLLLAFAKFGRDGSITDNAGTGGLWCSVDGSGTGSDVAFDEFGGAYETHPTTGFSFATPLQIPGYETASKRAIEMHAHIPHFDLVSWDIAISEDAQPVFIEANFKGASWIYQMAARRSMFDSLTDEILEAVRDSRS